MSWYDKSWGYRWPVLVDNTSGATTPIDVSIVVPSVFPTFWDNLGDTTNGDDIRLTTSDGVTLATYQLTGFNFANQTVTVQADNVTPPANDCQFVLWLYWGNAAASSGSGSFTASAPLAGYVYPANVSRPIVSGSPVAPGATEPGEKVQKTSDADLFVWLDLRSQLAKLPSPHNGSTAYEEVDHIVYEVLNAGTDESSEHTDADLRMLDEGGPLVRLNHVGGSDNDDRTLSLQVVTTLGRTLNPRVLLNVRDIDEA